MSTIKINLPPADMLRVMRAIDDDANRGFAVIPEQHGAKVSTFQVMVDGSASPHIIRLRDDGMWTAETEVEA